MSININPRAQQAVEAAMARAIDAGEVGLQVAAYLGEDLVVDAWAGVADAADGRMVDGDTLFPAFSVTKGLVATAVHLQAERGLIDYDAPMAFYWPEYGANGKAAITVRQALTHCTGTPQMPPHTTPELMCDWDAMAAAIAALPPILPIGEPAYQSVSFGWVLGEIVRRSDPEKRSFRQFIAQEFSEPLGIADLWIGIDAAVESRIAPLINQMPDTSGIPADSLFKQTMPDSVALGPKVFERPDVRRATIPGVGGIFNARSAAKFFAIIANGGELGGRGFLSRDRVAMMCRPRPGFDRPDPVFYGSVMPITEGGYWCYDPRSVSTFPVETKGAVCAPGAGSSLAWADPNTGLAVAFLHNRMVQPTAGEQHPVYGIARSLRAALDL